MIPQVSSALLLSYCSATWAQSRLDPYFAVVLQFAPKPHVLHDQKSYHFTECRIEPSEPLLTNGLARSAVI
ncbi:hypothetical protein C8R41DRAFT_70571 [Lentinula lateritia]|uniref:Secreted protein n=1 Tax=Lentinula lateritia TaxID=40482 RepID=A0ABQ8V0E6_9AGAR|nr:hypothetical protein C8R41DRAFT_70571 [Lentinula lateritia]